MQCPPALDTGQDLQDIELISPQHQGNLRPKSASPQGVRKTEAGPLSVGNKERRNMLRMAHQMLLRAEEKEYLVEGSGCAFCRETSELRHFMSIQGKMSACVHMCPCGRDRKQVRWPFLRLDNNQLLSVVSTACQAPAAHVAPPLPSQRCHTTATSLPHVHR